MGDLSPHFSRSEFGTCRRGECPHIVVDQRLVGRLEVLRGLAGGKPLRIVSGYRCPACNRRVGGAPQSQHLLGTAADIPYGYATVDQARRAGFTGIGRKGIYAVHVDVRARPAEWSY